MGVHIKGSLSRQCQMTSSSVMASVCFLCVGGGRAPDPEVLDYKKQTHSVIQDFRSSSEGDGN